ncbi:MAG: alpha/beta fold hydrolase [Ignavibacteriaceae bacterium]
MKKAVIIFCLLVFTTSNLLSQKYHDSSIKIDSGYINVEGGKLFYEIAGEGDWIVLLHDGVVHREVWDNQFPVFAKKYRVVRYDRRGYGKSTFPKAPFSHIEDLNQLFVQLKIDKAIVFGMSGGGKLAIDFTLKYPEKVPTLVLVGAVVSGYGATNHTITRGGRLNSIVDVLTDPQKFLEYFGKEDPYEINPKNLEAREKFIQLLKENPNDINFQRESFVLPLERLALNHLSEIRVPALVLVGEYDMPDIQANAGVIEVGIPNAKREIIYKSGHLIPFDQPETFNAAVFKFLNGIEFHNILNSQGANAAAKYFYDKYKSEPDIVMFEEIEMNALGYQSLQNGKVKDAIEFFKLNTIAYPKSWNVYDSLGEAYLKDGQKELAIKNYKKSLELNPNNTNAIIMLKNLEKTK